MFFLKKKRRTIFIGDVHGCIGELQEMIGRISPGKNDRIIMLGDLINRGPDPAAVVEFVYKNGYECLMGNHEDEYLQELETESKYQELYEQIGPQMHEWIRKRPLFIEEDKFLAVHAGLQPERHPSRTERRYLLNIRTWDGKGEDIKNPDNPPWYEYYRDDKPVFYGHWARAGLNLRENTFGLDSGCVYGKQLSAYVLETKELIQVQAHRVHYIPPSMR